MEPLKTEIDALREVMFTPVDQFVTEKERAERGEEAAEKLAHKRMFSQAIKAVDAARGARTLYTVVLRFGRGSNTFYSGYGPYATKGQAEKAVAALSSTFDHSAYAIVPTRNAEGFAAMLTELDAAPESKGDFALAASDGRLFALGWKGNMRDRKKYEAMA